MKTKLNLGRGAAILACAASLAGTAAVVAPTAASARGASTCANKTVKLHLEGASKPYSLPVKAIKVEGGVSCAEAYKVITEYVEGKAPAGWKSIPAKFEAPEGLVPQAIKKGSKKIKYAIHGG
ncbi:MAG TPA: hypothetical protein VMF55_05705 [Solirubrobacterales bacterium]|nr:hypothetical protein [Solirubrobacterales bacterium]